MKKFAFQLAPVLRWRESIADREKQALEQLHLREQTLRNEHEEVQRSLQQASDLLALSEAVEAADLAHLAQFKSVMQGREQRIVQDRQECRERIAEQQVRCTEADRAQKLLVRLQDQKRSEWLRASDREIEASASELYLAKWVRNRNDS
jgi:hypothetical protein